jgi:hypothetical protein
MIELHCPINKLKGPEAAQWRKAVEEELESLLEKGCWIYVPYPQERIRALRAHLVLKKKTHNGEVVRFKARLVVNGSQQEEGITSRSHLLL